MAHEITSIDKLLLNRDAAWHGLGVIIDKDLGAVEAGKELGLFWDVEQWSLTATGPNGQVLPISSHVANVRSDGDIRHMLGIVGADYKVCQNRELAEFTDALAQTGKVKIETCGSIRGGERVWFLAKGEDFKIGDKDRVHSYVLVSNGHDGGQAIRVTPTSVRVVCSNTLHMVIPRTEGQGVESAAIAIRHSGQLSSKLEDARIALAHYDETRKRNREMMEMMQTRSLDRDRVMQYFALSYANFFEAATEAELKSADFNGKRKARARTERMADAAAAFLKRFDKESKKLNLGETVWGAFNAMSGWLQHDRTDYRGGTVEVLERKLESNLFGMNAQRTETALANALAIAV